MFAVDTIWVWLYVFYYIRTNCDMHCLKHRVVVSDVISNKQRVKAVIS